MFLDDLPEDFNDALHEYNMDITKAFASFLLNVSKLADMKQEYQLPLSKIGKYILAPLWNNLKKKKKNIFSRGREEPGKDQYALKKSAFQRRKLLIFRSQKGNGE